MKKLVIFSIYIHCIFGAPNIPDKRISLKCKSGGSNPDKTEKFPLPGKTMVTILNFCTKKKDQGLDFENECLKHCDANCKIPYGDCSLGGLDNLAHCTCYLDPNESEGYQVKLKAKENGNQSDATPNEELSDDNLKSGQEEGSPKSDQDQSPVSDQLETAQSDQGEAAESDHEDTAQSDQGEVAESDQEDTGKTDHEDTAKSDDGTPKSDQEKIAKSRHEETTKFDQGEAPQSDQGEAAAKSDQEETPQSDHDETPQSDHDETPQSDQAEAAESDQEAKKEELKEDPNTEDNGSHSEEHDDHGNRVIDVQIPK